MKNLYKLIGRISFAGIIIVFSIMHFTNAKQMAGIVPSWLPGDILWVYLTGIIMLATAILIIADVKYGSIAALVLAGTIMSYVLFIHLPDAMNAVTDQGMQKSIMAMLKDIGLVGAALLCAATAKE